VEEIRSPSEQRKKLWGVVLENTGNPELVNFTANLIKKNNVPERNDYALARTIQVYSQKYIKFFRERPERFAGPLRTILWGLGDCDDKSTLIASVLRSFRVPVRLKFIRFDVNQKDGTTKHVSHVYPQFYYKGKWLALESVHPWAVGDDPEDRATKRGIKVQVDYIGGN